MEFSEKIKEVQQNLMQQNITGWLLYDFRGTNPLACQFLDLPINQFLTRRFFYWIPQKGEPIKIISIIEPNALAHLPGLSWVYKTWQEMEEKLFLLALPEAQIAMEYSPYNSIPVVSKVDAGTVEIIQKNGAKVVSSANLLQKHTSEWTSNQLQNHLEAAEVLIDVANRAWSFMARAMDAQKEITEYQVQQFMVQEIQKQGCVIDHPPICAVNSHSADPHYSPQSTGSSSIRLGDFILLDLWCKRDVPRSVYADITRVGVMANQPTTRQQEIFQIVKQARAYATQYIQTHYEQNHPLQAWQADQVCRDFITRAGYEEYFIHRTGHNIGEQVHGPGANLDNFETHDFRFLLPGTCFSVEPGIYLPQEFGVRLEYDVYLDAGNQIRITGGIQEEIICLNQIQR